MTTRVTRVAPPAERVSAELHQSRKRLCRALDWAIVKGYLIHMFYFTCWLCLMCVVACILWPFYGVCYIALGIFFVLAIVVTVIEIILRLLWRVITFNFIL